MAHHIASESQCHISQCNTHCQWLQLWPLLQFKVCTVRLQLLQYSTVYQHCIPACNKHWSVCHPCGLFPQWHYNNLLLCFGTKCPGITWQRAGQGLELGSQSGSLGASHLETHLLTTDLSPGMLVALRDSLVTVGVSSVYVSDDFNAIAWALSSLVWSLSAVKSRWWTAHITVQTPVTWGSAFTSTPSNPVFSLRGDALWKFLFSQC